MSLDRSKLQNIREQGKKTIARCPACEEEGRDKTGNHLVIMSDGHFGCVVYSGESGKEHRKRIFALAGTPGASKGGGSGIRVRRPVTHPLMFTPDRVVDLGQIGRVDLTLHEADVAGEIPPVSAETSGDLDGLDG